MNFEIYGPFDLPKKDNGLVDFTRPSRKALWAAMRERAPGLPEACGCYVLAARGPQGALPHYVGLASKQSFEKECSQNHVIAHINNAIANKPRLRPQLFLVAKVTPQGRFAKPSKNPQKDIVFLEGFMIGLAVDRNKKIGNSAGTKYLKNVKVAGFMNASRGARPRPASAFKKMIGR